jgi:hypothetical protein
MDLLPSPADLATLKTIADIVGKSSAYPHTVEDAFVSMLHGWSLGIGPIPSLSSISAVKGRPMISASAQLGLAHRSGVITRVTVQTPEACTIEFRRGDALLGTSSFTAADARRAKLGGNQWQGYPEAMLFARAVTQGIRRFCPEVLGAASAYDPEEIREGSTDLESLEQEAGVRLSPTHTAQEARDEALAHPEMDQPRAANMAALGATCTALAAATTISLDEIKRKVNATFAPRGGVRGLDAAQVDDLIEDLDRVATCVDPVGELDRYLASVAAFIAANPR